MKVSLLTAYRLFLACINRIFSFYAVILAVCVSVLACSSSEKANIDQFVDFESPTRIAISESGRIYVADHKKGYVVILDSKGRKISDIRGFSAPLGLAVIKGTSRRDTLLFVGDKGDGSVQVFRGGEKAGVLGSGSGEFLMPNGIAVTRDLTVYVVDSLENQVLVYDSSGTLQTVFGGSVLNFPTDIALNETVGELYISDFNNRIIRVYDLGGDWLRDIYAPLNGNDKDKGDPVFWKPAGIGIDTEGNLYVVDNALSCVAKINSQGDLLQTIGYSEGEYWTGELSVPIDAAVYGTKIYVTSNGQRQLKIFEVAP